MSDVSADQPKAGRKARAAARVRVDETENGKKQRKSIQVAAGGEIEQVDVDVLIANPLNARVHPQSQIDQLAYSIKKFGFNAPIVIDGANRIYIGHGRVMAAKAIGLPQVPAIRKTDLSEGELQAYALMDNKITLNSSWDEELLKSAAAEVSDLIKEGVVELNSRMFGWPEEEWKDLIARPIELPDLGDGLPAVSTPESSEDRAEAEDVEPVAEFEEARNPLEPVPDAPKERYHQLPPDEASRAIKPHEERIPVGVLLSRAENDQWLVVKQALQAKTDKSGFLALMQFWTDANGGSDGVPRSDSVQQQDAAGSLERGVQGGVGVGGEDQESGAA